MFLHSLKYSLKSLMRNKVLIFWSLIFCFILGTFFKIAFSGITESTEALSTIDIAVIYEKDDPAFSQLIDELSGDGGLFRLHDANEQQALELLENGELTAVIRVEDNGEQGNDISLETMPMDSSASGHIQITIVKNVIEAYITQAATINEIIRNNPSALPEAAAALSGNATEMISDRKLSQGNMDSFIQYFFNLIAMCLIMGSNFGVTTAMCIQGNLSALAARRCVSPARKSTVAVAGVLASIIIQFCICSLLILYLRFVLSVDLGDKLPMVFFTAFIGSVMGVSLGFAIGSIGRISEGAKSGISTLFATLGGFLSGLMVSNMRMLVAEKASFIHKINPSSLLTDAFYSLAMYGDYSRYTQNIIIILVISAACVAAGILMTRRRTYASL